MKRSAEEEVSTLAVKKAKRVLEFHLAVRCGDNKIRLYDRNYREVWHFLDCCVKNGRGIAVNEQGEIILNSPPGMAVSILNTDGQTVKSIPVGENPWSVGYDIITKKILVPMRESNCVRFYEQSGQMSDTVDHLKCPQYAMYDKKRRLLVGSSSSIQILGEGGKEGLCQPSSRLALSCGIDVDGANNIISADYLDGTVHVMDENLTTKNIITLPFHPFGLAVDPDTDRLLVPDCDGNRVVILDTQSREVLSSFDVPNPLGLAFRPGAWQDWKPGKTKRNIPINALIKAWHLSRKDAENPLGLLSRDSILHELVPFLYNTASQ